MDSEPTSSAPDPPKNFSKREGAIPDAARQQSSQLSSALSVISTVIREHPLVVIASATVAVASIVTAANSWFFERARRLEALTFEQRLEAQKQELGKTIDDLTVRLAGIERRVGGQKLYIDVTQLSVPLDGITQLGATYKPFLNGTIYLVPPVNASEWSFQAASQLDMVTAMMGTDVLSKQLLKTPLGELLSKQNAALWIGKTKVRIPIDKGTLTGSLGIPEFAVSPFIFVMPVDESYVKQMLGATGRTFQDVHEKSQSEKSLKTIANLTASASARANRPTGDIAATETKAEVTPLAKKLSPSTQLQTDQYIDALAGQVRDDMAGFMLDDAVTSQLSFAANSGASFRVSAAEKKGNVFYLRNQQVYPALSGNGSHFAIDVETFFVGTGNGSGVLIRIVVPSIGMQSDAYRWTQAWLTSLRIPLQGS